VRRQEQNDQRQYIHGRVRVWLAEGFLLWDVRVKVESQEAERDCTSCMSGVLPQVACLFLDRLKRQHM
jgi:hypothetical protein